MPRDKATRDASNAAYRERNRAAINARTRARIAAAPEKNRERVHAWEAANPERVREYQSRWGKANRDKTRAWNRRQYHANPEKYRASNRRREKLVNDVSRESASHHGEPWTGPQLELAARDDLTAVQVAPMLGRTVAAVRMMRAKLREDPKIIMLAGLDDPADAMTKAGLTFGPVPEVA